MGENIVHGFALLSIGATVAAGILLQESVGAQLILAGLGLALFTAGAVVITTEKPGKERGGKTGSRRARVVGSAVVLLSVGLPYLPLPTETDVSRTAYSFVGLVYEMWQGTGVDGGLTLLIFASVVFAGAAASLLHYTGGYVVLFGVAGYTHVVSVLMGKGAFSVFFTEFRAGVYVATVGGLLVVVSSLLGHSGKNGDSVEFIHESYRYRDDSLNR